MNGFTLEAFENPEGLFFENIGDLWQGLNSIGLELIQSDYIKYVRLSKFKRPTSLILSIATNCHDNFGEKFNHQN
ncbi:MAG: hypothetical protein R2757_16290 [Draconibacterium sp.]